MEYTQPVKVGDTITETIINLGAKGDGIAKHKQFTIIVPQTKIQEKHKLKIIKVFEKYAIAQSTQKLEEK